MCLHIGRLHSLCSLVLAFAVTLIGIGIGSPLSAQAPGDGQMYINDQTYAAGSTGQQFVVRASYGDFDCLGYSVGLGFDTSVLSITDVTWQGALPEQPDFFDGRFEGGLIGYGCVIDFSFDPSRVLAPTADQPLLIVTFDVLAQNDTTTQIIFTEVPTNPERPIRNVLTDATGTSRFPTTAPATLTIERRFPIIDSFAENTGPAGKTFFVVGQFFGEGNLAVNVCQVPATFILLGDGQTLQVTAPDCTVLGPVTVEVCNTHGCTSDAAGFTYVPPPPSITGFQNNAGLPGSVFTIEGDNFDGSNLAVTVCGTLASASLEPDGTVTVTAPACATIGAVEVSLCTDDGCDSDPAGFTYLPPPPVITGLQQNSGFAGSQFVIEGENFDGPNLQVSVCALAAAAELQPDGSLLVTAPDCPAIGPADLDVCTDHGCDAVAGGFIYEVPPTPAITGFQDNSGRPGDTFVIEGANFDQADLSVTVCAVAATALLQPDGTLLVTAPECAIIGPAAVEVCTDFGCDSDPAGFTYVPPPPRITGFQNNSGLAGAQFTIEGENFGGSNLAVTVCSAIAIAFLQGDGTLLVTAPECAIVGPVAVEVCTDDGCDSDAAGFTYLPPPPRITGFQTNSGLAGAQFTIEGEHFDAPNLLVTVCDAAAEATLQPDGTLLVTAPDCATIGPVAVEVCTDHGCDSAPNGFTYDPPVPIITGFQNNSGRPGAQFVILGEHFGQPDLAVTVCARPAPATLEPDGSLLVTAPECETVGPAEIQVCTVHGCDRDPEGFSYDPPPPLITGFQNNSGRPGAQFTILGENFGGAILTVTVCEAAAAASLQGDGTLLVTAPECATVGAVEVQVCTDDGCDTDPAGFIYDPPPPRITGFQNNSGLAGAQFTITGENFDGANLAVMVCATLASASLQPDGSLLVTAPECASIGPVEVQVCTDDGCDSDSVGFTYEPPPPIISGFQNNSGLAGAQFVIEGRHFDGPNLAVTVCSTAAAAGLRPDGTLLVTAPACAIVGAVEVEVCTNYGCDSDPAGFTYLETPTPEILGFSDNSGRAGDTFLIHGANFDAPELAVTVCGRAAAAVLEKSGSLRVTAPECAALGPAAVEVCTVHGCDSRADGFNYEPPPVPEITGYQQNSGRPGDVFIIEGNNFELPDVTVSVCGVAATFELAPGNQLQVTAPECATIGPVEVVVCNMYGCDTDEAGFIYDPPAPDITGFVDNNGRPGHVFAITGENFDGPNLVVTVCDSVASASLETDGSIRVTAPACASIGPVEVQVCTDHGCDSDPAGFSYDPPPPRITGFQNNSGRPGRQFVIEGENFDGPNLVVTVCAADAPATLLGDGSLLVAAPECASVGPVEVQVCTDHGCDSVTDGFTYVQLPPVITGFEGNAGRPGDTFTIRGENFDASDLVVRVCGQVALAKLNPDNASLQVTAPDCEVIGSVPVVVCTSGGCAADEEGFVYESPLTPFIRSDSNCDGHTDIADPVHTLNHLFRAGTAEPCCLAAADANGDLLLDVSDPLYTLNHFFLGGDSPPPPAPYPDCGTADGVADCDGHLCE